MTSASRCVVIERREALSTAGLALPPSEWVTVTQERIDLFAEATGDRQWIHTDPERAQQGPYGTTIAHGFWTLSLVAPAWMGMFDVVGSVSKINYGLNRVRFTAPVPVGSQLRMEATIADVRQGSAEVLDFTVDAVVQRARSEKPALVCQFVSRFTFHPSP